MERIGLFLGGMVALVVLGVVLAPSGPEEVISEPVVEAVEDVECVVIQDLTLEMLDPVYSEKAVYDDGILRASFDITQTIDGVETGLSLWLHNSSADAMVVHWDRCSFQLPSADTVNIVHEDQVGSLGTWVAPTLTIGPGGDLFTAIYPISDVELAEGWSPTLGVLTQGPFSLVLAVEAEMMRYYAFRFIVR